MRHAVSSKPKRSSTISSESRRCVAAGKCPFTGGVADGAAASISGISSSFRRSKIARTSAVFMPGS